MNTLTRTLLTTLTLTTLTLNGCGPGGIEDEDSSIPTETGEVEEEEEEEQELEPCVVGDLACWGYDCLCNMNVQQAIEGGHFTLQELEAVTTPDGNGTLQGTCDGVLEKSACLLDVSVQGQVSLREDPFAKAEDFGPYVCATCQNRVEEAAPPIFPLADPYPEGVGGACGFDHFIVDGHPELVNTYMTSDPNEFFMPIGGPNPYCSFESEGIPTGDHLFEENFNFGGKVCTGLGKGCSYMCWHDSHCEALMGNYAFQLSNTPFCGVGNLDSQGQPALCGLK